MLWLLAPAAAAQQSAPAFELVVRAPEPLQELLERNMELRRYREVTDHDDAEISRLIVLAEKDARELLATQGYFRPDLSITREPGPPVRLVVAVHTTSMVEPGDGLSFALIRTPPMLMIRENFPTRSKNAPRL